MNTQNIFEQNFLTVNDISQYLNISANMGYQLAHRKDFPTMYVGTVIRIPTAPFLAWVEQRTRVPKALNEYLAKRIAEQKAVNHVG